MFATDSFLTFSFPAGRLAGVPLRLSFLLPVVVLAVIWRLQDAVLGLTACGILLLSLILHELAHLVVARRLDHYPGIVVLWPLGGLQTAPAPSDFRSALSLALSGPIVSLAVAAAAGIELNRTAQLMPLLNPFAAFDPGLSADVPNAVLRLTFVINWCLGLFNLIPIRPLDGGQALLSFLNLRLDDRESRDLLLRLGLVITMFGMAIGFVFDVSGLVALSAALLVLHLHEATQTRSGGDLDVAWQRSASTSRTVRRNRGSQPEPEELEGATESDPESEIVQRWRRRRDEERLRREADELRSDQEQLDGILDKLHANGRDALTPREVGILNRMSARLRQKNLPDERHA